MIELPRHLHQLLGDDAFDEIMHLNGDIYRSVAGRRTIKVKLGRDSYFIKQHFGVGWSEIIKSLLSFKKPVLDALTEVAAIRKLDEVGIPTTPLVGYGCRGSNPATRQSFLITQDLGDIVSLDELCADWSKQPPDPLFKKSLVIAVAKLSALMHGAGICHRDFYLCHIVMKRQEFENGKIHLILIDLHRMLMEQPPTGSAVMKDIAALYFSSMDCGFTTQDWQLFREHYLPQSLKFWQRVERRAHKLYRKFHSQKFQNRLLIEQSAKNH